MSLRRSNVLRHWAARANLAVAAVLMLAVWVLIVWVASRPALKTLIDLTPQQSNSVDPATEELLRELREQKVEVEFHLFFPRIAGQPTNEYQQQWMAIRNRLQELTNVLLTRYQWLGGETIEIRTYDLANDLAATREAAQAFGYTDADDVVVVAVRQPGRERRFRKLSLSADLAHIDMPELRQSPNPGQQMQVPVLKRFLGELAISSTLKSLLVQGTPVAYFLNSYSRDLDFTNASIGRAYGGFVAGLTQLGFETRVLERGQPVPRDAALVIVLEPRTEFTDVDAGALFEYCKRGGRLFLNYSWAPAESQNPTGGKLGELLGYELGTLPVFHVIRDKSGRTGGRPLSNDPAVAKLQLQISPAHPVTRRLAQVDAPLEIATARELRERSGASTGVTFVPLLQTGEGAWLARPGSDGRPDLQAPSLLSQFLVGAAIEVAQAPPAGGTVLAADAPKGQVVIVTGVFCNNVGLPQFGDLAFNICNWMAERKVLMNIQSGGYTARQLQLVPQQIDRIQWLLCYGVPLLFLAGGLVVYYLRRRI